MRKTNYIPPPFFNNGHIQTLFPPLFRKVIVFYQRQRIRTPDDDFLDLDWSCKGNKKLVIICHGLEGNTHRAYVKGMVNALNNNGWDALAWNYRSCSGEPNRRLVSYHNGITNDLSVVIEHAKKNHAWNQIALVGFSMGGNLSLLYLGREAVDPLVKKAVVFSVPCDLQASSRTLAKPINAIYMKRFLIMLHKKIKDKMVILPGQLNDKDYGKIKDFKGFDDRYTAPIHGFKNAEDYWEKCSSKPYISKIKVPTLIINAKNDPFLPPACFPIKEARANSQVTLRMPESGGHVGFISFNKQNRYWSEAQTIAFLNEDGN